MINPHKKNKDVNYSKPIVDFDSQVEKYLDDIDGIAAMIDDGDIFVGSDSDNNDGNDDAMFLPRFLQALLSMLWWSW